MKALNERGAAMVDYAILLAMISIVAISSLVALSHVMPMAVCGVMSGSMESVSAIYDPSTHTCYQDENWETDPFF